MWFAETDLFYIQQGKNNDDFMVYRIEPFFAAVQDSIFSDLSEVSFTSSAGNGTQRRERLVWGAPNLGYAKDGAQRSYQQIECGCASVWHV